MVDCNTDFNLNVDEVKRKITPKTKVIIPVDIAGWPCDYEQLNALVQSTEVITKFKPASENQKKLGRILILSDAAHSLGAVYKNKSVGCWADFTVFSFHAVKNVTTAEGGAMVINLPVPFNLAEVYRTLKLWSLNGQTKDALAKTNGAGWKYDIVYAGFKMNMPDICAAIGVAQIKKYKEQILPARQVVFDQYISRFNNFKWAQLPPHNSGTKTSSYHLFALRVNEVTEPVRDRMIEIISERGVSVNVHFQPLPLLTVFKNMGYSINDYPNAFDNYSREISLPIYPGLESKTDYIVDAVVQAYQEANG
ncbi:MAG TPA: DegT/DnrJ/EryC1/StrS family aminotransferase [Cyclobacteriaceae bacterium]|nr:DegT/DnrJ/EryC1/StrS family aminotransferase [Cyclobacteriaceae bacterium]